MITNKNVNHSYILQHSDHSNVQSVHKQLSIMETHRSVKIVLTVSYVLQIASSTVHSQNA